MSQRVGAKRHPMINSAKFETGWGGGLSTPTPLKARDCHPNPAAHFIRVDPPPQGEGK
jgi:hypothetical protein